MFYLKELAKKKPIFQTSKELEHVLLFVIELTQLIFDFERTTLSMV